MAYNVAFVAGPGHDNQMVNVLDKIPGHDPMWGASKQQVLDFLRPIHEGEEGWLGPDMEHEGYRDQQRWGDTMLAMFEATGHSIVMPVRHGAYVVVIDLS